MINKNFYRKTNDKKILHKVGKQWKVVSVALLMAIGGVAVASHANANADVTGDTPQIANAPTFKPAAQSATPATTPTSAGIHYYGGHSGSAASYFDKAASEETKANKNYATVNAYVTSLNDEYNPQVHSLATSYNSANTATHTDSKLASSYNAKTNTPATTSTINSLAAKNSMDPSIYVDYVRNTENTYSGEVKSASADQNAANAINSLVNSFENTNWFNASLSASEADFVARSNYNGASAVASSLAALGYGATTDSTADYAKKLVAGVGTLDAEGDPVGYNAHLSALLRNFNNNGASQADAQNAVNNAVSGAVSSANGVLSNIVSNYISDSASDNNNANMSNYANGAFDALVDNNTEAITSAASNGVTADNGNYVAAVSAAVAEEMAANLQSAANVLDGGINGNQSYENSLYKSAANKARAYSMLATEASVNDNLVSSVASHASAGSNAAASYLVSLVDTNNTGDANASQLEVLENNLGIINMSKVPGQDATYYGVNATPSNPVYTLNGSIVSENDAMNPGTQASLKTGAQKLTTGFVYTKADNTTVVDKSSKVSNGAGGYHGKQATSQNPVYTLNGSIVSENDAMNPGTQATLKAGAQKLTTGFVYTKADNTTVVDESHEVPKTAGTNTYYVPKDVATTDTINGADLIDAALLSDGVDIKSLNNEAPAVNNVLNATKSTVSSAAKSYGNNWTNTYAASSANNLNNALSVAASSADTAENVANNSSEAFSAANDENVTLASYFASSYSTDANNESSAASNAYSVMNKFFVTMAGDPDFTSADSAYAGNKAAASNDHKMGVENVNAIYNTHAHFLDVLKDAALHSTANFGTNPDKVVARAHKGDRLTVLHTAVSRNNNWRGVLRYYVLDNTTGKKGFITGQPNYTKGAYLPSTSATAIVSVKALRPVNVYNNYQSKGKPVATLKAGQVVHNVRVVYANPDKDAMGFTKVETPDYNFFSANTDYVVFDTVTTNNNNNNNNSKPFYGLDLGNNGLGNDFNDNSFNY